VLMSSEDVAAIVDYKRRSNSDNVSASTRSDGLGPVSCSISPDVPLNSGDVVPM
ncbi:unnamed protein product, partial [Symbiodinium pilosum]